MATTKIQDICSEKKNMVLVVRVCRLWRWLKVNECEENGLQLVLVDAQNSAIHAIMRNLRNSQKICQGLVYRISKFHCMNNLEKFIIVPHEKLLLLDDRTQFEHIPQINPIVPFHWFAFIDYNHLNARVQNNKTLSDVIGRITQISPNTNEGVVPKITMQVQNLRDETITVCLTKDAARRFNSAIELNIQTPMIAAFTSTMVKYHQAEIMISSTINTCVYINPSIDEAHYLRTSYQEQLDIENNQPIPIEPRDIQVFHETFIVKAVITTFEFIRGWYYFACPNCNEELMHDTENSVFICPSHGNKQGTPLYRMDVHLEDESGVIQVELKGRPAEPFFGLSCRQLIEEKGEKDKDILPQTLADRLLQNHTWELAYQRGKKITVQGIYPNRHPTEDGIMDPTPMNSISQVNKFLQVQSTVTARRFRDDGASTSQSTPRN